MHKVLSECVLLRALENAKYLQVSIRCAQGRIAPPEPTRKKFRLAPERSKFYLVYKYRVFHGYWRLWKVPDFQRTESASVGDVFLK